MTGRAHLPARRIQFMTLCGHQQLSAGDQHRREGQILQPTPWPSTEINKLIDRLCIS